jgi:hypothetical protein
VLAGARSPNQSSAGGSTPLAVASPSPSPSPSPVVAPVLTGEMDGEWCPVAHVNDAACWHGIFVNTGPTIANLALTFVVGGGYTNWFSTHRNPALSGFYTTSGCTLDARNARMLCGQVGTGAQVQVYLGGDVSKKGTYRYAVKFSDVAGATPVYVDQNPDGTHRVVTWIERIV